MTEGKGMGEGEARAKARVRDRDAGKGDKGKGDKGKGEYDGVDGEGNRGGGERPGRERGYNGGAVPFGRFLVAVAPRNRRAHLPRADQLHSSRGEGGNPMVAGRQGRDPCQRYARRRRLYAWMAARSQSAI